MVKYRIVSKGDTLYLQKKVSMLSRWERLADINLDMSVIDAEGSRRVGNIDAIIRMLISNALEALGGERMK